MFTRNKFVKRIPIHSDGDTPDGVGDDVPESEGNRLILDLPEDDVSHDEELLVLNDALSKFGPQSDSADSGDDDTPNDKNTGDDPFDDESEPDPFADDADEPNPADEEEATATANGWMPEEDWVAAGNRREDWVSAKEFNFRGQLMGQTHRLNKELKRQRKLHEKTVTEFRKQIKKLAEFQRNQKQAVNKTNNEMEIAEVRKQLQEARYEDDIQRVNELEDKIIELKLDARLNASKDDYDDMLNFDKDLDVNDDDVDTDDFDDEQNDKEEDRDYAEQLKEQDPALYTALETTMNKWQEHNPWYGETGDPMLTRYAEQVHAILLERTNVRGKADLVRVLKDTTKAVRNAFPQHAAFIKQSRKSPVRKASSVTRDTDTGGNKIKRSDLTPLQRSVAKTFIDLGVYKNIDEYIADQV